MLRGRYCVRILRTHIPNWINKVLWVPFSCRKTHFPFNFDVILAEIVWFQFEIWIAWIISWTTYYLRDLLNFWKFGDVVSDFPITNFIQLATCVNSAVLGRKRSLSTTCCGVIVGLHLKKKIEKNLCFCVFYPNVPVLTLFMWPILCVIWRLFPLYSIPVLCFGLILYK